MAKVIERNVPIAEENVTLSGQPATNMFEDWSEEVTDKAENPISHRLNLERYVIYNDQKVSISGWVNSKPASTNRCGTTFCPDVRKEAASPYNNRNMKEGMVSVNQV